MTSIDPEADDFDPSAVIAQMNSFTANSNTTATVDVEDEETLAINDHDRLLRRHPRGCRRGQHRGCHLCGRRGYLEQERL